MRHLLSFASVCVALAVPACGGTVVDNTSTPVPSCSSSTLVASSPIKAGPGSASASIVTMAATPSGDRFLVVWGNLVGPPRQAVVVRVGDGAPSVSSPVTVPGGGVAAFDGTAFDVIGSGLAFQRIDLDGRLLGPTVSSSTHALRIGWPAATTSSGVAVIAYGDGPSSQAPLSVEADLLGSDGRVLQRQPLIAGETDPYYGFGPIAAVAPHDGDAFVLSTNMDVANDAVVLSALGGSGEPAPSGVGSLEEPSNLFALFPVGNELAFPLNDGTHTWLWKGAVNGSFARVGEVEPNAVAVAADGCGRIVTLSGQAGTLSASAWSASTQVQVATDFTGPAASTYAAALVATSYGFGVAWSGDNGLELATLGWK